MISALNKKTCDVSLVLPESLVLVRLREVFFITHTHTHAFLLKKAPALEWTPTPWRVTAAFRGAVYPLEQHMLSGFICDKSME